MRDVTWKRSIVLRYLIKPLKVYLFYNPTIKFWNGAAYGGNDKKGNDGHGAIAAK